MRNLRVIDIYIQTLLTVVLTCAFPLLSFSQSADSMMLKFTDKRGVLDVGEMLIEFRELVYTSPDVAFELAGKTLGVAMDQGGPLEIAKSNQFLGAVYFQVKAEYDSASHYFDRALEIYKTIDSKEASDGRAMILHNLGTIYEVQGDYAKSFDSYIQALRLLDETENSLLRPYVLNNISVLYALSNDPAQAEIYARRSIDVARRTEDQFMVATASIALVGALMNQKKYQEAYPYLKQILEYGEKNQDKYKISLYHLNYGIYLKELKKDYAGAVVEFEKGQQIVKSIPDEWEEMRHSSALAEAYLINNQFTQAHSAARRTLEIASKLQAKDKIEIALTVMSKVNATRKDYATAFAQLSDAYLLRDTLVNDNNRNQISFLDAIYQTERKEFRIESLEKQRRFHLWLSLAGGFIFLILIALIFARYRLAVSKRKLAQQDVYRLQQEKQLVAVQATLDGETAERSRLARDLHDGLGSMLSAVKFNLPAVNGNAVIEELDVSRFQRAIGMLDDSIKELRRVAHHMMPESLIRYGLNVALSDFCAAIPIAQFHYYGSQQRLPEKIEVMIYRSVHELVNNALKHAESTQINVQLLQEDDLRISLIVQDNGKGFNAENVTQGMGLTNIRQRVDAVNGKLEIFSTEMGTEVHIDLELNNKNSDD